MVLTAQGPVMVSVNDKNEITGINTGMGVTSLPIIGVYMPGKRTTLLADVANILSGVKGGSLNVKYVAATENGKISSGELTFFYDK